MEPKQWIKEGILLSVSSAVEGGEWYPSKILKVGGKSFFITPPKRQSARLTVESSSVFRVRLPSEQGLVQFTSRVLGQSKGPDPSMELEFPQEITRMERRAYPRIPIRLEAYYSEIHAGSGELAYAQSLALDISAGGILLETNRPCPQETLVRLKFQLPAGGKAEDVEVIGRIARSMNTGSLRNHQVGVEFIDISPRHQESVVRFVTGKLDPRKTQA
jgi:c-di-GMP-binding flagellar brake protein YcgR